MENKISVKKRKAQDEMIAWLEKQEEDKKEDLNILQRFSFYSYKDEPNILYLAGVFVNEEYRNKGIGSKILEIADEVAKSMRCNTIRLKVKKDTNAYKLYLKKGYNILTNEGNQVWLEKQMLNTHKKEIDDAVEQTCCYQNYLDINHY